MRRIFITLKTGIISSVVESKWDDKGSHVIIIILIPFI